MYIGVCVGVCVYVCVCVSGKRWPTVADNLQSQVGYVFLPYPSAHDTHVSSSWQVLQFLGHSGRDK